MKMPDLRGRPTFFYDFTGTPSAARRPADLRQPVLVEEPGLALFGRLGAKERLTLHRYKRNDCGRSVKDKTLKPAKPIGVMDDMDKNLLRSSRKRQKENKHNERISFVRAQQRATKRPTTRVGGCTRFELLASVSDMDVCEEHIRLRQRAVRYVRLLEVELSVKAIKQLPDEVLCGGLRHAVRQCFPPQLTVLQELSFKTVQKAEHSICSLCEPAMAEKVRQWKKERFQCVSIQDDDLEAFGVAFRGNVPKGWNNRKTPFFPNGHATLAHKRREGGNWNEEAFNELCRAEVVFSSGKPRIVTCYSGFNTQVLSPLHHSLYEVLRRKGWLLVGDPTNERVQQLNGVGDYVSVDYAGATDSIRAAYVNKSISILEQQSEGLTEEERRCLRVLGELRLVGEDRVATVGQPMGSVMSFPLLCLINKTVFDLALTSLMTTGQISFKEWTSHRCLINGDDLLFREPRQGLTLLRDQVRKYGALVGFRLNEEKTLVDTALGEINSTLFVAGEKQQKTNVSALEMAPDVSDAVGFALEAMATKEGFRKCMRSNAHILARQPIKLHRPIPLWARCILRRDKKLRRAMTSMPLSRRDPLTNPFPVVPKPEGYVEVSFEQRDAAVRERVELVRAGKCLGNRTPRFRTKSRPDAQTFSTAVRIPAHREDVNVLEIYAKCWERQERNRLSEEEHSAWFLAQPLEYLPEYYEGGSMADALVALVRSKRMAAERPRLPAPLGGVEEFLQVV